MFKKVLIANRGEIAVRVMRTLKEMGIKSVAVYSDIDRKSLHVNVADEAYPLGGKTSAESYLVMEKIIEAAKKSGAEAIHPGYGFLSENEKFAKMCEENNIVFIGPPPKAIVSMGDKVTARRIMQEAGVPIIPGLEKDGLSEDEAFEFAKKVGFPVMIKASAGGGGKGMRKVENESDFSKFFRQAKSEALSSFGDDRVYIEKFLEEPRHIEIQILGDKHGNVIYLGERECSVQRRHQKVIEESPSPFIDEEMRRKMGETAVKAAKAVGYYNAGTVEFLVDKYKNFYFLEMNTRLQVEHPVTEWVTGIDLVEYQIRVAAGERLDIKQEDVKLKGHAIECRIYAEDPEKNFMPSPGKIERLLTPSGPGVRDDSGVFEGAEVSLYYDPMISKLTVFHRNRDMAIKRMLRALDEYVVAGIKTNIDFHKKVLTHPDFVKGKYDTTFIDNNIDSLLERDDKDRDVAIIAALIEYYSKEDKPSKKPVNKSSRWKDYAKNCWTI
ncbi:acetyl-CoA carboxylase, biotin carboxylase subunit [Thermotomaculum hydrothermale]|uniref:Acetyl-CoA carboxylase, biotin carboxylase subunit n=1 Tax=Thermotomaculum hydrothermale TaxID=981385 RepID=A0A7R6SYC2_9BACT|nr:acetyl-CoA carboxylase biotin carboxylase subunit [Thermotomaculum hydrothermale]BBB31725.1 acetyl-CoA carboxylase, biotin carboxylase subunit [Thermotomaculum hydrothermale]